MTIESKKRTFVVEIERKQIVRKTSEARLVICAECRAESDFISLRQAATIFNTDAEKIFEFIEAHSSHYKTGERGEVFICLTSFIAAVNNKANKQKIKLLNSGQS